MAGALWLRSAQRQKQIPRPKGRARDDKKGKGAREDKKQKQIPRPKEGLVMTKEGKGRDLAALFLFTLIVEKEHAAGDVGDPFEA